MVVKDNKKTYPPNWVVMQNNIQECFKSMVGFKFTVREKHKPKLTAPERDQKTVDMFRSLSDSQINMYSSILSKVSSISDLAGAKDYQAFAIWIANILRDPKSVKDETAKRIFKALRTHTDFKN